MGLSSSEKQRRYRARRATGRMLLRIEVDDVNHPELLIKMGYLRPNVADQQEAIERATEAMIAALDT